MPAGEDVEVIYSSAVPAENPERVAARERGLAERPRAELLAELSALRRTIAVAGTHGKTTTASMLVHALRAAGLEPGWLVGGAVGGDLTNAEWLGGEWLVVEADESDRSMLSLQRRDRGAHERRARPPHDIRFARGAAGGLSRVPHRTARAVIWDRPELLELRAGAVVAYDAEELALTAGGSRFRWQGERGLPARPRRPQRGQRRRRAGGRPAGRRRRRARSPASPAFAGRRGAFSCSATAPAGALVYDDYAHHPTEIAATLLGARTLEHRRLVAVFQPHLFSRTALLAREFGLALARADVVVVLDVYPARERAEDHPGVSGLHDRGGHGGRSCGQAGLLAADVRRCRAGARRAARRRRRVRGDGRRGRAGAGAHADGRS